jgi:hypothetical protein
MDRYIAPSLLAEKKTLPLTSLFKEQRNAEDYQT